MSVLLYQGFMQDIDCVEHHLCVYGEYVLMHTKANVHVNYYEKWMIKLKTNE